MTSPRSPGPLCDLPPGEGRMEHKSFFTWLKKRLLVVIMFGVTTFLLCLFYLRAFGLGLPSERDPWPNIPPGANNTLTVTLPGYGSFQGTRLFSRPQQTVNLGSLIDSWLNVEYAQQPVGPLRWTSVSWPDAFNGTRDATEFGPACWQNVYGSSEQSEACLTLNIFRPSGIPMGIKLPVLVYLHGGAFVGGSHRSFDGALFVQKSQQPLIVVTVQYRLGALGSLPAKFMEANDLLNLNLRDQKMSLKFVQRYIQHFGGDPERVTLGGQSAGAHSVGIHLFHNYNNDTGNPLFHQVILASGSPTARAFPGTDYPLYKQQTEHFMDYVNCKQASASDPLQCLRAAEVDEIQFISSSLYNANDYNITWPWQPVSPGPLFEKRGSTSGENGTFFKVPTMISSVTDEGTMFAPQNLLTNMAYLAFWKNLVPDLTPQDLSDLEQLYPDPLNTTKAADKALLSTFVSPQFERISAAYGDYSYICPVQDTASRLSRAGVAVYKARFDTPNYSPAHMGVRHASDVSYFNGRSDTQYPAIANVYSAYWASFVVSGDPNTFKAKEAPTWDKYIDNGKGASELVVSPDGKAGIGGIEMEKESDGIRMKQCKWWRDEDRAKRLNK